MKHTAMDWLFSKLWDIERDKFEWESILKEAKEMEKEQLLNAYLESDKMEGRATLDDAEQYYNETFNPNK
jgi:transposase InsO family protein